MKKINPLYLLLLMVILTLFLAYKTNIVKKELKTATKKFRKTKELALKLHSIKKAYDYSEIKEKRLIILIKNNKNIKYTKSRDKFIIEAKDISANVAGSLITKILNDTYNISYIDIKKLDKKLYLKMEIKW